MSKVQKLSVSVPSDVAEAIRDSIASGAYSSASAVVREAVRDWQDRRTRAALEVETLRRLWRDGIDSGPGRFDGIDAIKAAARARR